jgi:glycosyltransferase involved in cell wall biosynthesis
MPTYCLDLTIHNTLARHRGIGRYALQLAHTLSNLQSELEPDERLIALAYPDGPNAISESIDLLEAAESVPFPAKSGKQYSLYERSHRERVPATLARLKPDVVHFMEGPRALFCDTAKTVVTCHDLIPLIFPKEYLPGLFAHKRRRKSDHKAYHGADRVIAISHSAARDIQERLGVPQERITIIHQGVDHATFNTTRDPGERDSLTREFGIPARYSLYVGANDARKRIPLLLAAQAAAFRTSGVPLVLVGDWTANPPAAIRAQLAKLPAGACVFAGELPSRVLPALYRNALVHALPSIYEGFGLTVLEAMASGCPVITTRGGALPEASGDAALCVAADSEFELSQALIRVVADDALRARMRDQGIAHAARFQWEHCARATLAVYRAAIGRHSGSITQGAVV